MRGQWYIVASILISFSLVSFFYIYNSFSSIDFTSVAKNNIDYYSSNIVYTLNKTKANSWINENKLGDIGDLLEMIKNVLIEEGYFLTYKYDLSQAYVSLANSNFEIEILN